MFKINLWIFVIIFNIKRMKDLQAVLNKFQPLFQIVERNYRCRGRIFRCECLAYGQFGHFSPRRCAVGGRATKRKCQLGSRQLENLNLSDFLGTIFILIDFCLINATNEHYSLIIIYFQWTIIKSNRHLS